MHIMIVLFVLSRTNSAVPKCIFLEVATMTVIFFIAMIYIAGVTFPYLSIISLGKLSHFVPTCLVGHLVVFTF